VLGIADAVGDLAYALRASLLVNDVAATRPNLRAHQKSGHQVRNGPDQHPRASPGSKGTARIGRTRYNPFQQGAGYEHSVAVMRRFLGSRAQIGLKL